MLGSSAMDEYRQNSPVSKKLELWRRRLDRAHDLLDREGIMLYTWRRGEDVVLETIGLVEEALGKGQNK